MSLTSPDDTYEADPRNKEATREPRFWTRHAAVLVLLAILAVAAFFRFYGRDFDQGHNQHPDERAIVGRTLTVRLPTTFDQLLDPRTSPLNLRSNVVEPSCPPEGCRYPWGSLPVYVSRAFAWVLETVLPPSPATPDDYYLNNYSGVTIAGRHVASIFDLITILLVFLIARRLYSSGTALIAAALVALAVTHIQIAHFYISEPFLVTFMTAAVYFSVVLAQRPSWWAAALAGVFIGFAVASKVSIAPFALVVVTAVAMRAMYRRRTRKLGSEFEDPVGVRPASAEERRLTFWSHAWRGARYVLMAAIFAFLGFAITEPYALWQFDWSLLPLGGWDAVMRSSAWGKGILDEAATQGGQADLPFTRQYIGTVPLQYQLEQLVLWGMGVLPGLVALAGFAVALWRSPWRRPAEAILLSAALPYFATILVIESKWMRYMLPLVPIFAILGAAFLVRGMLWARARHGTRPVPGESAIRKVQRYMFPALTAASLIFAFLWAFAFTNIYTQPHSRVQASEWIYNNVPDGSSMSAEGWDDALPFGLPSVPDRPPYDWNARGYQRTEFNLYDDRAPEQAFQYVRDQMAATDYILLASNRLYGSIPRLPWRYPVQTRFYQLLFEGKLGYQLVHTSQPVPELFGIKINDQLADESFTVYDHPRVDVFKKTSDLTEEQLRILFSTAIDRPLGEYSTQRHGTVSDDRSLMYEKPLNELPLVGDFEWNPLGKPETQWIGVVLWLLAVYLVGFIALPLTMIVFRRLPDRGYAFARLAGLLLLSWPVWLLASARLVPFTVWSLLIVLAVMAGLAVLLWRAGAGHEIRAFWREKRGLVIFYEALFLAGFALFLVIRILHPDLWHTAFGGERPMEFGFLNATLRSPWMPPADPFFAGGYINYYYHGQFIVACLIKLTGLDTGLAFNLALPLLYGLMLAACASIVYNIVALSRNLRGHNNPVSRTAMVYGVLGGILALVIGNLHALAQVFMINSREAAGFLINLARDLGFVGPSFTNPYTNFNFWDPSRISAGTINEFPYWSFLYGDLHPHLINMPFTVMAIGLALSLALSGRFDVPSTARNLWSRVVLAGWAWLWGPGWRGWLTFLFSALTLGTLIVINSWDFPTFVGLAGAGMFLGLLLSRRGVRRTASQQPDAVRVAVSEPPEQRLGWAGAITLVLASGVSLAAVAGLGLLAHVPFFLNFKAFFTKVNLLVEGEPIDGIGAIMRRTTLPEFTLLWAIFLFITLSYLVMRLWRFPWSDAVDSLASLLPRSTPRRSPIGAATSPFRTFRAPLTPALAGAAPNASAAQFTNADDLETQGSTGTAAPDDPTRAADLSAHADESDGAASTPVLKDAGLAADNEPVTSSAEIDGGTNGPERWAMYAVEPVSVAEPEATGWVADANVVANEQVRLLRAGPQPGVIPLWAGLGLLALTAAVVLLQLAVGQPLVALLLAILGGLSATILSTTRSIASMFGGAVLVTGWLVALGVELVWLADHLTGSDMFRMNTIFKFYIQVWVLVALGCAVAVYYIVHGLRDRPANETDESEYEAPAATREPTFAGAPVELAAASPNGHEVLGVAPQIGLHHETVIEQPPSDNWLVWSADALGEMEDPEYHPEAAASTGDSQEPSWQTLSTVSEEPLPGTQVTEIWPEPVVAEPSAPEPVPAREQGIRWTIPRIAWAAVFLVFLLASFAFPIWGTPSRIQERFPVSPPIGTLDGRAYMSTGVYQSGMSTYPIVLNYDLQGIRWLNANVPGLATIVELPAEYYRAGGMRVAANTGLPMVVGGLHQDEQRAGIYSRLVGDRQRDVNDLLTTPDIQRALIYLSKYDVDYIYLGQLEQAKAGLAGIAKFEQMADPEIGLLREVFRVDTPDGAPGTIIYQVVREDSKDPRLVVGAPTENSGIPGISITPLPTPTPVPPPTPPVDDPVLSSLMAAVAANPADREARLRLMEWFRDNGYPQEAAAHLEELVKMDPQSVNLRHMLGDMYQAAGMPDKALAAWEAARDVAPGNPDAHNKVGIAYMERRRYPDAIREFEAAVQANPAFVESWFHLGEVHALNGDVESARRAWQAAIDNSREPSTWTDAARQRLDNLR
ncbi:MAG TPA: DUF2298 domain-containing protein [Chloroflexia bacterium]|nr:DUF2298 domain-containing protein [Chloroflexia bacterium]